MTWFIDVEYENGSYIGVIMSEAPKKEYYVYFDITFDS